MIPWRTPQTTPEELDQQFGAVRSLVQEVTDDKSLPKQERKRLQIKLADKICNLGDITATQPVDWTLERKRDYLDWAEKVVAGCRGCSRELEQHFDLIKGGQRSNRF
jgi:guanosine-3',5'-bis(diphosphate) 3'-pyrophosphohydrolase